MQIALSLGGILAMVAAAVLLDMINAEPRRQTREVPAPNEKGPAWPEMPSTAKMPTGDGRAAEAGARLA